MDHSHSLFDDLPTSDAEAIRTHAELQCYKSDEQIFSQGEQGDAFFIINEGRIAVHFDDAGKCKLLCNLSPGEYFGEMGVINHDKRSATATAAEPSTLLRVSREKFQELASTHPLLIEKMSRTLALRNEELILRESLSDAIGIRSNNLYVSIKGDPSLRETALFRERYESPVDKILDKLQPNLQELLLNRCIFQLIVNFNSGEIRVRSVFDPFREKVHTADRLIDQAYIDRHFTRTRYEDKLRLVASTYEFISNQPQFNVLPEQ